MKQKREREEPCPICQHYHDYLGGERCGICGHMVGDGDVCTPSALPTEVVPGFIFIGSFDHASRADLLKTLGITHVLNTVPTCPCLYKNSFTYYECSNGQTPSFEECTAFLETVRAAGTKVLVHCMSGNSRSPSIALYYLMKAYGQKLDQAYAYLKGKRPSIAFNEADAGRIMSAEQQVFGAQASRYQLPVGKQALGGPAGAPFGWPGSAQHAQQADNGGNKPFNFAASGTFGYNAPQ